MRRRCAAVRAWKALAWGLGCWAALQVAWGFAIDVGPVEHLDPEYAEREHLLLERLADNPNRPLVLALGSSRTAFGLHAARLSSGDCEPPAVVFNFALKGAGPNVERLTLRRLVACGVRPDLLLVEVLPPLFTAPNGPHVEAFWLKGERLRTSELAEVVPRHARQTRLLTEWARSRLLPGDVKRDQFLRLSNLATPGPPPPFDQDGYGSYLLRMPPEQLPEVRKRLLESAHAQYHTTFGEFRPAAVQIESLRALLRDARRAGIPTVLFVLPEAKDFQAFYAPGHVAAFDAFLTALAREEATPLVNARDWVSDEGFWDGHHLLADGAAVFTDRFGREAVRPLLGGPPGALVKADR
jgi:hypothetical protein